MFSSNKQHVFLSINSARLFGFHFLSFEFKLKDKNSDAREFTVSNANIAGSENIQKVETIAEEIDSPSALVLKAMMQKFNDLADRTRTSERVQEIKSKIRKLLK